jgi:hypothetical protein
VGQTLVILVLGSVVYAIIESKWLGWTSPVILGLVAVAVLGALGIVGHEPRRADPAGASLVPQHAVQRNDPQRVVRVCAFGAFLFVTTLYLQDVQGMPTLVAGLCLLPVAVLIVLLGPLTGWVVGARGPRLPLVVAGATLAAWGTGVGVAHPDHPDGGRAIRCSASSWAPSTRRSPTRRSPGCPPR